MSFTAVPASSSAPLFAEGYQRLGGRFDELFDEQNRLRPHWQGFVSSLNALGVARLQRRWEQARLIIHANGVSYDVHGDPGGVERPWNLSPVPFLLSASEWSGLERGIAQRARLLDALLADLYGAGTSLTTNLLPPALIFGRPSFLRPCHGMLPPQRRWLSFYAADLIRASDGTFQVFADRTQAPTGAGYALENRIVISQALPEAFRDCNVERLALFFRRVQETLAGLAPHNRDNPRVVLLSPGPYNATYLEQAYLAQYLGYTLVTGADLTVRDGRVVLKTLGGLQPVDVILRRVNDDYCDPLELRPDTVLGVPGLVQACRAGNVAVANALGTGLVRSPALLPYLPALCKHLLGEDLRLPSVPSWWCGDPQSLSFVLENIDEMVLKPAYAGGYVKPLFIPFLVGAEREKAIARLRSAPQKWVAQKHVPPSTTPVLKDGRLQPRPVILRSFAVSGQNDYHVMPGGLARVASAEGGLEVTMQVGVDSKDVWVQATEPVSSFSLLAAATQPIALSRGGGDLPSRVADNLYWLGRYAERCEGLARTARVLLTRLQSTDMEAATGPELLRLAEALGAQAQCDLPLADSPVSPKPAELQSAIRTAVLDPKSPGSVASAVKDTLRVARMVRDRLSLDSWKGLAALEDDLDLLTAEMVDDETDITDGLSRLILGLSAFSGLAGESMNRGQAWRFLDMGRRLERAIHMALLLRHTLRATCEREGPLLDAVLEIADSSMTYRRRYLAALQVAPVVDLLLTDETNPRAVIFQAVALDGHLQSLSRGNADEVRSAQQRLSMRMVANLRLADVTTLCSGVEHGERVALDDFLDELLSELPLLSDHLTERFLTHTTVSRNLNAGAPQE